MNTAEDEVEQYASISQNERRDEDKLSEFDHSLLCEQAVLHKRGHIETDSINFVSDVCCQVQDDEVVPSIEHGQAVVAIRCHTIVCEDEERAHEGSGQGEADDAQVGRLCQDAVPKCLEHQENSCATDEKEVKGAEPHGKVLDLLLIVFQIVRCSFTKVGMVQAKLSFHFIFIN